jgi:hypothetical protein
MRLLQNNIPCSLAAQRQSNRSSHKRNCLHLVTQVQFPPRRHEAYDDGHIASAWNSDERIDSKARASSYTYFRDGSAGLGQTAAYHKTGVPFNTLHACKHLDTWRLSPNRHFIARSKPEA